jgi:RimJ/RimL family protein N-acetyltransferase
MGSKLVVDALEGRDVRLEPLSKEHVGALVLASGTDRTTYGYTTVPRGSLEMSTYVDLLLEESEGGVTVPFVQIDVETSLVVGMTRYLTLRTRPGEPVPYAVEIGGTWLSPAAQRSAINTEAKFLLLRHAFEVWGVTRVDLKTDDRNERSRAAITRLGATFEGVLRHWQPSLVPGEESMYRDSAMFSVIDTQWSTVASRLRSLMDGARRVS